MSYKKPQPYTGDDPADETQRQKSLSLKRAWNTPD